MDCATYEHWLLDLLEDTLPAEHADAAERHVASCDACRSATEEARRIRAAYAELPVDDVGDELAASLLAEARGQLTAPAPGTTAVRDGPPARTARPVLVRVALLAAAALLLVVLGQLLLDGPDAEAVRPDVQGRVADLLRRGEAARDAGDDDTALGMYQTALRVAVDAAARLDLHHRVGELHLDGGRPELALPELNLVLAGAPDYPRRDVAMLQRAQALEASDRLTDALEAYEQLAAEFPDMRDVADERIRELDVLDGAMLDQLRALGYMSR